MNKYIEISKEKAKENYCDGKKIFISNNERNYWKMPSSSEYGSHASIEDLFYRGIPMYEGDNKFFIEC